ncbi:conserved hypothetical protein [Azospirillaceae bacterium]
MNCVSDRVGLGWRPELTSKIMMNLDQIDIVEVIAENLIVASLNMRNAMRALAKSTSVSLHGVSMGLASALPVDRRRLAAMASLVHEIQPESWSEHLSFVRAGGIEIGHLAAPPRTQNTIDGCLSNLAIARQVVGAPPALENIATLIEPLFSVLDEPSWISAIFANTESPFLLDLHNLYANAVNFGWEPLALLKKLPLSRVSTIHLSGGCWIGSEGGKRLLDDHIHDVPTEVFDLLTETARRAPQPLTVIIERDGAYPPFSELLLQIAAARSALAAGRSSSITPSAPGSEHCSYFGSPCSCSEFLDTGPKRSEALPNAVAVRQEVFLARLYTEPGLPERVLDDAMAEAARAELSFADGTALANVDVVGLPLAVKSFRHKRESYARFRRRPS